MSAVGTATINIRRGRPYLLPSLKTFGIGVLSLLQQIYEEEETSQRQVTPLVGLGALVGMSIAVKAIMHSFSVGTV